MNDRLSPAEQLAAQFISELEKGVRPWVRPWEKLGQSATVPIDMPLRANGEPYRGVNVFMLWLSASLQGFGANRWMTYKQAEALGGQVRKGCKGTKVVYYGQATKAGADASGDADGDDANVIRFLKGYVVFNVDQVDGLADEFYALPVPAEPRPEAERIAHLEAVLDATGAHISHGGDRAFFAPGLDAIRLPTREQFRDIEQYYATAFHELIHWTGHTSRLNRQFGAAFGDANYAREELVAELGSALVGATLGLRPDHFENHAAYLGSWIKVLKDDPRTLMKAAAAAQAASDFILQKAGVRTQPVSDEEELPAAA